MRLQETRAFLNKQYQDASDGSFLKKIQYAFLAKLSDFYRDKNGALPDHIFYADDCFVLYRNLGFLKDEGFISAVYESNLDKVMLARIWRIWLVCWSLSLGWTRRGAFLDCGTYNGKAIEVAIRYCQKKFGDPGGSLFAYDLFEDPPDEARKKEHGPHLYLEVSKRLGDLCGATVVKGRLPSSLNLGELTEVAWAQVDLNSAEADLATFQAIFPRLQEGAVIIFDDYGFSRYHETQVLIDEFLEQFGGRVLELPTGQGIYFHRGTTSAFTGFTKS